VRSRQLSRARQQSPPPGRWHSPRTSWRRTRPRGTCACWLRHRQDRTHRYRRAQRARRRDDVRLNHQLRICACGEQCRLSDRLHGPFLCNSAMSLTQSRGDRSASTMVEQGEQSPTGSSALRTSTWVTLRQGDTQAAETACAQSLEVQRRLGPSRHLSTVISVLAVALFAAWLRFSGPWMSHWLRPIC